MAGTTKFGFNRYPQTYTEQHQGVQAEDIANAVVDNIDAVLGKTANYADSAAIAEKFGTVTLSKATASAMSIADPAAADEGKVLRIVSKTAAGHVITVTGGIAGGSNNTITLGGAIGDTAVLVAINSKWYLQPSINATASQV